MTTHLLNTVFRTISIERDRRPPGAGGASCQTGVFRSRREERRRVLGDRDGPSDRPRRHAGVAGSGGRPRADGEHPLRVPPATRQARHPAVRSDDRSAATSRTRARVRAGFLPSPPAPALNATASRIRRSRCDGHTCPNGRGWRWPSAALERPLSANRVIPTLNSTKYAGHRVACEPPRLTAEVVAFAPSWPSTAHGKDPTTPRLARRRPDRRAKHDAREDRWPRASCRRGRRTPRRR